MAYLCVARSDHVFVSVPCFFRQRAGSPSLMLNMSCGRVSYSSAAYEFALRDISNPTTGSTCSYKTSEGNSILSSVLRSTILGQCSQ